jgi:hypothetical protein
MTHTDTSEVNRLLRAYRRDPHDELVGEWPIRGLTRQGLNELFGAADEMYDCYPVREEQAPALERATGIALDLDRYDYFVEADAV